MTLPMLDILRTQKSPIRLRLVTIDSEEPFNSPSADVYRVPTHQFVRLQAKVANTTGRFSSL